MNNDEYRACSFINKEMYFYNFPDFLENAEAIKNLYKKFKAKGMYKWYVYSNQDISKKRKDAIWNYLNDDISLEKLTNF